MTENLDESTKGLMATLFEMLIMGFVGHYFWTHGHHIAGGIFYFLAFIDFAFASGRWVGLKKPEERKPPLSKPSGQGGSSNKNPTDTRGAGGA